MEDFFTVKTLQMLISDRIQNIVHIISWFCLFIFQLPVALAPNIGTVIVCRGLQGLLGIAPATNTGGTIHDLWVRDESGPALSFYAVSSVQSTREEMEDMPQRDHHPGTWATDMH